MNFSLWDDIFKRDPNNDKNFLMEMILRRKKKMEFSENGLQLILIWKLLVKLVLISENVFGNYFKKYFWKRMWIKPFDVGKWDLKY